MFYINNFMRDGEGKVVNWKMPIGRKSFNTPLFIDYILYSYMKFLILLLNFKYFKYLNRLHSYKNFEK